MSVKTKIFIFLLQKAAEELTDGETAACCCLLCWAYLWWLCCCGRCGEEKKLKGEGESTKPAIDINELQNAINPTIK